MKLLNVFIFAAVATITTAAQAQILSVTRDTSVGGKAVFDVEIAVCNNAYPSVVPNVTKLSDSSAQVTLKTFPGNCSSPTGTDRFLVDIDYELNQLGLDPLTTTIFVQLQ